MSEQNTKRRRTLSCSGNLGLYVYLHGVENMEPEELAAIFHEKAEQVRQYAEKLFDDVEDEAAISAMWDSETLDELDEKEYYEC